MGKLFHGYILPLAELLLERFTLRIQRKGCGPVKLTDDS